MTAQRLDDIGACVFDAYGTLFDVHSAVARCHDRIGPRAAELSEIWRRKQLEYTWLRSLMGRYEDFWRVTGDALDYAMAAIGQDDAALRSQLMQLYLTLDAYPDVAPALEQLKAAKMKLAILSNGTMSMLVSAAKSAGLSQMLDEILSVDAVSVYKPHASVYQLAVDKLEVPAARICFVSANGWDAAGGALFGLRAAWINRAGAPRDNLASAPACEIASIAELPALIAP
ncbi:MAG: haloacid dehalogenase type II [Rhodospirillales bacterium]